MADLFHKIRENLRIEGTAAFSHQGKEYLLNLDDVLSEVEVCEKIGENLEYLFSLSHESELAEWIEELLE